MTEPSKITDKAAQVAAQAAAAAGPLKDRAAELAAAAAAAAAPVAARSKERAVGIADKAGEIGAKGVNVVAEGLDKVTGGRFAGQINAVAETIEKRIDPDHITPTPRAGTTPPDAS
jgi:hypothetical protein